MDSLQEVFEEINEALNSDDPNKALSELAEKSRVNLISSLQDKREILEHQNDLAEGLVEHMAGITCIMYLRQDDCVAAIRHTMGLAPGWADENHHCEKDGDHEKFLRELLIWTRVTTEKFLGVEGEKALS